MYKFSPMMVANSWKHHYRVRIYTREVLVLSTNLEIQTKHYPLVFRNRRGDEARIKKTCSLIPLSRGSFDVIVGMDWLSKRKFVIVCYEKVVRIPLEGDEIFRVHRERTLGAAKALMNAKRQVEFRIDLVHGATPVAKSSYHLPPSEMQELSRQLQDRRRNMKFIWKFVLESLEEGEAVYNSKEWNSGDDQLRLRWMIYLVVLADAAESVRDAIGFEYCLASSSGWTKGTYESDFGGYNEGMSPVLWAEIRESSLIGPELVLETADKVVLIKEKLKAMRDRQKSYVDFRRKPLESEVGDRVLLKVSPWNGVVRFGKKGKLAPRYVGPFEILERIGLVAYRLRLPEELNSVHDTFHVSNLKKCLGNANLHVPLNEIKIDKTLRFVEEPVEIMDREIKSLKRSRIPLVKVRWNSKRGPEFTWEREDYMKSKYPHLFVDRAVEPTS
ncbi:hypothetical protein Tco_0547975 [Tanacetum coccineum]